MNDPNGPPPPPMGFCVCPGFFGRPFEECSRPPFDGDLAIHFECPAGSAIFNGSCKFRVDTSDPLALLFRPREVLVPRTAAGATVERVFNTMANDPPGGLIAVTITDLAPNGPTFSLGNVLVSNSCP